MKAILATPRLVIGDQHLASRSLLNTGWPGPTSRSANGESRPVVNGQGFHEYPCLSSDGREFTSIQQRLIVAKRQDEYMMLGNAGGPLRREQSAGRLGTAHLCGWLELYFTSQRSGGDVLG